MCEHDMAPPCPPLLRATTEPPPDLGGEFAPPSPGATKASLHKPNISEVNAMTPPPPPIDQCFDWSAISEKNTFLSVRAPAQPGLFRSRTDPSKASALEEPSDSDDEPQMCSAMGAPPSPPPLEFFATEDHYGPKALDGLLASPPGLPAPPPLSLEFVETDDPFGQTPAGANRLSMMAPPPMLSLDFVATDDPFRPTPTAPGASGLPSPPPLALEFVDTADPFAPTPTAAGWVAPPMLPFEYLETDDPFPPLTDPAEPPGLGLTAPPPPPLTLESFDTEDHFEEPLQLVCMQPMEPAFVQVPVRTAMYGPPPPPVALAPLMIGSPVQMPPPPPPPSMPLLPAPMLEAPSAHDVPVAEAGHTPGAGILELSHTDLERPGLLARPVTASGCTHVHWAVDARKLEGQDKQAVSQVFQVTLPGQGPTPFKLVLYPKATNDGKHGAGFKKAKGKGRVVLKCEAQLPESFADITFRVGVGRAGKGSETLQPFRGPVSENFFEHSCHGLAKSDEDWDFTASIEESRIFMVTLEIAPSAVFQADPSIWWAPL